MLQTLMRSVSCCFLTLIFTKLDLNIDTINNSNIMLWFLGLCAFPFVELIEKKSIWLTGVLDFDHWPTSISPKVLEGPIWKIYYMFTFVPICVFMFHVWSWSEKNKHMAASWKPLLILTIKTSSPKRYMHAIYWCIK